MQEVGCMSEEVRPRILLGEDEEDDVVLFRLTLRKAGVKPELTVLNTAEEILEALRSGETLSKLPSKAPPSIIFIDGQLHHQPSMGLLRSIMQNPATKNIPVFILTGSLDPAVCTEAKAIGALECFQKPFTVTDWFKVQSLIPKAG